MSGLASKQQSLKIFEKLKTKQANKVSKTSPLVLVSGSTVSRFCRARDRKRTANDN